MKKILTLGILLITGASYAQTSEFFGGMDSNAVSAGISKYIITRGGKVSRGEGASSNIIQAVEQIRIKNVLYTYNYVFKLTPEDKGTKLDMIAYKSAYGSKPAEVDILTEQKIMEAIKGSIKGRFLYGLGFEYSTYNDADGTIIKAPKGREKGIVLTNVKYDALKQGLMPGDVIIEINKTPLNEIPLKEYASVLNAKSITDTLNLTIKRGGQNFNVDLKPRMSNNKTF